MLDDLRNSSSFIDDEEPSQEPEGPIHRRPVRRQPKGSFLGMSAPQRFVVSLMLFFMICLLGVLALAASGSIVIPGF